MDLVRAIVGPDIIPGRRMKLLCTGNCIVSGTSYRKDDIGYLQTTTWKPSGYTYPLYRFVFTDGRVMWFAASVFDTYLEEVT